MRFQQFINEDRLAEGINYEMYCAFLDGRLDENMFSALKDKFSDITGKVADYLKALWPIKDFIEKIATDLKVGFAEIVKAFKERKVFDLLRAIRFNIMTLFRAIKETGKFVRQGLFKIFEDLSKTKVIEQLRRGTIKIDDFLDQYPILKKLTGIAIAGILIYIWLSMTFIGDFDYDFNVGDIVSALSGGFSISDLFLSPSGLMMIALFATGGLISFPWLGKTVYNIVVAVAYTGYTSIRDRKDIDVIKKLKKYISDRR